MHKQRREHSAKVVLILQPGLDSAITYSLSEEVIVPVVEVSLDNVSKADIWILQSTAVYF